MLACLAGLCPIESVRQDVEKSLKKSAANFEFHSLATDATTGVTTASQLAIFICGITDHFETRDDLLSLIALMHRILVGGVCGVAGWFNQPYLA